MRDATSKPAVRRSLGCFVANRPLQMRILSSSNNLTPLGLDRLIKTISSFPAGVLGGTAAEGFGASVGISRAGQST
jgi:hypothetical protein